MLHHFILWNNFKKNFYKRYYDKRNLKAHVHVIALSSLSRKIVFTFSTRKFSSCLTNSYKCWTFFYNWTFIMTISLFKILFTWLLLELLMEVSTVDSIISLMICKHDKQSADLHSNFVFLFKNRVLFWGHVWHWLNCFNT